jgi:putative ABC transport system substrate-binding protein
MARCSLKISVSRRLFEHDIAPRRRTPTQFSRLRSRGPSGIVGTVAAPLLSYGANVGDMCRRSAALVDKILKGRKPADLPVEPAHRFELVVNLKTAKQIGVTVPPNVLVRADRVIE